ncbi:M23 family metallopeptidase [Ruthenibacterium lactatiformans]|uniref:M23 family metallopeptidase n=1 Tax=Ruthenibacterium lactatiformans TaxID=1550024 RepID=UPI0026749C38|nr:M23 family metallopeptidase [Ruthenibacterium lactatiformans]
MQNENTDGTPVLAAAGGTVTVANATDPWGGSYGYYVKIQHDGTFNTLYAHCSSICVTPGQRVQQGEVIGYVGSTGNSTGNHLHFEVWENGQRRNAIDYFDA